MCYYTQHDTETDDMETQEITYGGIQAWLQFIPHYNYRCIASKMFSNY